MGVSVKKGSLFKTKQNLKQIYFFFITYRQQTTKYLSREVMNFIFKKFISSENR